MFLVIYVSLLSSLISVHHSSTSTGNVPTTTTTSDTIDNNNSRNGHNNNNVVVTKQQATVNGINDKDDPTTTITIGIASTVTGCGSVDHFVDGAAILKYSLDRHSKAHGKIGKYNYKSYILYHPNATECVLPLQNLGYTLLERPTPIDVEEIQGQDLRERIVNNGCCGEVRLYNITMLAVYGICLCLFVCLLLQMSKELPNTRNRLF